MRLYNSSYVELDVPSFFWIGYKTKNNNIKVLRYKGEDYYTGWGMRKKLLATTATKTTPPFLARCVEEAMNVAYMRLLI